MTSVPTADCAGTIVRDIVFDVCNCEILEPGAAFAAPGSCYAGELLSRGRQIRFLLSQPFAKLSLYHIIVGHIEGKVLKRCKKLCPEQEVWTYSRKNVEKVQNELSVRTNLDIQQEK